MTGILNQINRRRAGLTLIAALLAAAVIAATPPSPEKTAATASDTYFNTNNANLALLWATQAAEYQALCLQTYNAARAFVRAAAAGPGPAPDGKPAAVVMDLDETVLDNYAYMTWLDAAGRGVSWDEWPEWERDCGCNVRLIPGALDFIKETRSLGIAVVFISNREEPRRADTIATLVRLGVIGSAAEVSGDNSHRLLLYQTTNDKNPRRDQITARYRVIAYVGDSLGDFPGGFQPGAAAERTAQVGREHGRWGAGYFILPNPTYGKWLHYLDPTNPEAALPMPGDCGGKCKLGEGQPAR